MAGVKARVREAVLRRPPAGRPAFPRALIRVLLSESLGRLSGCLDGHLF